MIITGLQTIRLIVFCEAVDVAVLGAFQKSAENNGHLQCFQLRSEKKSLDSLRSGPTTEWESDVRTLKPRIPLQSIRISVPLWADPRSAWVSPLSSVSWKNLRLSERPSARNSSDPKQPSDILMVSPCLIVPVVVFAGHAVQRGVLAVSSTKRASETPSLLGWKPSPCHGSKGRT